MGSYRLQAIDASTWLPASEVAGVESISFKADADRDGSSPLMQSCMLDVAGRLDEGYYRISELDGAPGNPDRHDAADTGLVRLRVRLVVIFPIRQERARAGRRRRTSRRGRTCRREPTA